MLTGIMLIGYMWLRIAEATLHAPKPAISSTSKLATV
jgi:hypothetical protein